MAKNAQKTKKRRCYLKPIEKARAVEFNLALDVNNLKQEIRHLELRKQLLQSRAANILVSLQDQAIQVTREILCTVKDGMASLLAQEQRAVNFFMRFSDPHVASGNGNFGVGAFLERVRRCDSLLPLNRLRCDSMQAIGADRDTIVTVRGHVRLLLTNLAIETIYPHLRVGHDEILQRLREVKALVCPCTIHFVISSRGKLIHFGFEIDFVTGFMQIVENMKQVAIIMSQAMIGVEEVHPRFDGIEDLKTRDVDEEERQIKMEMQLNGELLV